MPASLLKELYEDVIGDRDEAASLPDTQGNSNLVKDMAEFFDVSNQVARIRLGNLGLIKPSHLQTLPLPPVDKNKRFRQ
jgi:Zn-dependent peptidase ImmA (M78 family)